MKNPPIHTPVIHKINPHTVATIANSRCNVLNFIYLDNTVDFAKLLRNGPYKKIPEIIDKLHIKDKIVTI